MVGQVLRIVTVTSVLAVLMASLVFEPGDPPLPAATLGGADLQPEADSLEDLTGLIDRTLGDEERMSVAVAGKDGEPLYVSDGDAEFALASVAKVYIIAAYLDSLRAEGEELSEYDADLLEDMITRSDNISTEYFWLELDEFDGMNAFLKSKNLPAWRFEEDDSWGDARQTATEVAKFVGLLTSSKLLSNEDTGFVLALLSGVASDQQWGVGASASHWDSGSSVLLKDGWYPEDDGWLVNSAGLVQPGNGKPAYVTVVLSNGFETFEGGVEAVEQVASFVNRLMLS